MKHIIGCSLDLITIAALSAGVFFGVAGAYNIAYLWIWIITVAAIASISVFIYQEKPSDLKKVSEWGKVRVVWVVAVNVAESCILAWDGRYVIAAACAFLVLLVIGLPEWAKDKNEQKKAKAEKDAAQ